jgi:hypothetical protein
MSEGFVDLRYLLGCAIDRCLDRAADFREQSVRERGSRDREAQNSPLVDEDAEDFIFMRSRKMIATFPLFWNHGCEQIRQADVYSVVSPKYQEPTDADDSPAAPGPGRTRGRRG